MRHNNKLVIFLVLLVALGFYLLGRKSGSNQTKVDVVQNVDLIKEIAELAALQVSGTTNLNMTNKSDEGGSWSRFKDYFLENTLTLSIPYDARYGVDMGTQKLDVNTDKKSMTVNLPAVKLLSMQLKLDQVQHTSKTGLLASATMDDFVKGQKKLYEEATKSLANDSRHIKLAEEHIRFILDRYYSPLGYKVTVNFGESVAPKLN